EDGIRDFHVTGVQTCALPIYLYYICDKISSKFETLDQRKEKSKIFQEDDAAHAILCAAPVHFGISTCDRVLLWNSRIINLRGMRSEERRVGRECRSWGSV